MNSYANKKYDFLWTSKRLIVLALLFGASFINYVDRINMSVAAPAIAKEFGWNPATMGIVLSSFLWAYAAALIPTGWLTDKVGARRMNALAVSFWSAAGMLTGMANSFGMMVSTRLAHLRWHRNLRHLRSQPRQAVSRRKESSDCALKRRNSSFRKPIWIFSSRSTLLISTSKTRAGCTAIRQPTNT
jgi:hypothetical protein